jgi:hypothetical protein
LLASADVSFVDPPHESPTEKTTTSDGATNAQEKNAAACDLRDPDREPDRNADKRERERNEENTRGNCSAKMKAMRV